MILLLGTKRPRFTRFPKPTILLPNVLLSSFETKMRIIIVDRAKFKRVGRQIANNQPVELATFLISSEVE